VFSDELAIGVRSFLGLGQRYEFDHLTAVAVGDAKMFAFTQAQSVFRFLPPLHPLEFLAAQMSPRMLTLAESDQI